MRWFVPRAASAALLLLLFSCGGGSGGGDRVVEGVNLSELFAPPTQAELDAVRADWATRTISADDAQVLVSASESVGGTDFTVQVVSHLVGGVLHYGAILHPTGALDGSLPVLVYAHGGDAGVDVDELLPLIPLLLGADFDAFVFVIPSFRAEVLIYGGVDYQSEGPPSPWDRDVDDALSLIAVAGGTTPAADLDRVGVLGFSRGAGVGLLMGVRDPSIDLVVEFFGPTDMFSRWVEDLVADALQGTLADLPGLSDLDEQVVQPLKNGTLALAEARLELLRRSPAWFAADLPPVQIHHGTADATVPVSQGQRLRDVLQALGSAAPDYEAWFYAGGEHDPLTLPGAFTRTLDFLTRLNP